MANENREILWEVTDTFGGEANYAWVKRGIIIADYAQLSNLQIIRRVKKAIGWNGLRCEVSNFGDEIWITPKGMCQRCFITFDQEEENENDR